MHTSYILHATTDPNLLIRLKETLDSSARADMAVRYSFMPGFEAVADSLSKLAAEVREFDGVVSWHGQRRRVVVMETGNERLLGTSLLSGSRISIEMRRGGEVLTEEDWPTQ